ncbi:hypothetical protein [Comamonas odontotermitis]|uniref:hypothetical protein n=1 Tax=Comamonas odontotermitis TaxID=379895 RepID=UPI003752AF38
MTGDNAEATKHPTTPQRTTAAACGSAAARRVHVSATDITKEKSKEFFDFYRDKFNHPQEKGMYPQACAQLDQNDKNLNKLFTHQ